MLKVLWKKQKIPSEWEKNPIIPIYKKEDQTQCGNHRAICLVQTSYKLYTRILEKRLRVYVEEGLEEEQTQTNDNICIMKNLIEGNIEEGEGMFLVFIDLKAALDATDTREIWEGLEEMEIPKTHSQRTFELDSEDHTFYSIYPKFKCYHI
ncbi:hypothetical protein Trydic_g9102 [Trypoxylus dichotomus]